MNDPCLKCEDFWYADRATNCHVLCDRRRNYAFFLRQKEDRNPEEKSVKILSKAEREAWLRTLKDNFRKGCLRCPHWDDEILCVECRDYEENRDV